MTGNTSRWCTLESVIQMTVVAGNIDMFPGQLESKQAMVEDRWQPTCRQMTLSASRSKNPNMLIVFRVAGKAIGRGTLEDVVYVAAFTGCINMHAKQSKSRQVMIESSGRPAFGLVAGAAIGAQSIRMRICLYMAGLATSWGGTQVCKRMIILMAFVTGDLDMFPGKFKGYSIMVEGVPVSIDAVMTSQAIIPIGLEMGLHEIGLDLRMAIGTDGLVKCGIAIYVAIPASKTGSVAPFLVRSQGISRRLMRELKILENREGRLCALVVGMAFAA